MNGSSRGFLPVIFPHRKALLLFQVVTELQSTAWRSGWHVAIISIGSFWRKTLPDCQAADCISPPILGATTNPWSYLSQRKEPLFLFHLSDRKKWTPFKRSTGGLPFPFSHLLPQKVRLKSFLPAPGVFRTSFLDFGCGFLFHLLSTEINQSWLDIILSNVESLHKKQG